MPDLYLAEFDLGGSWNQTADVSGSPDTVDAVEYRDRLVPWSILPVAAEGSLILFGRLPGAVGSLVVELWAVVAGVPDALVVADDVPITGDVFVSHTLAVPNAGVDTRYRLRATVTGADGFTAAFLASLLVTQQDIDVPVDCQTMRTNIANRALDAIGITDILTDLATDDTVPAAVMRRHFDAAVDEVLREFSWGFATAYRDLAWIAGTDDEPVNGDYARSFRLPSNVVKVRRVIRKGIGRAFDANPPQFKQSANDDDGRVLWSDYYDPESDDVEEPTLPVEVTLRSSCPVSDADAQFVEALVWLLASKAAPAISRNKVTSGEALGRFRYAVDLAKLASANERQESQQPERVAKWMQDR